MSEDTKSVLVVEDDPEINAMVGAYAELCGFEYRAALNGLRAMDEIKQKMPSLVVLDLMLPDLDGFEICSRIKSADATRHVPVIMLTALCGEQNRERGCRSGAADYLTKPFDPDKLMATMKKHARRNGNGSSR